MPQGVARSLGIVYPRPMPESERSVTPPSWILEFRHQASDARPAATIRITPGERRTISKRAFMGGSSCFLTVRDEKGQVVVDGHGQELRCWHLTPADTLSVVDSEKRLAFDILCE